MHNGPNVVRTKLYNNVTRSTADILFTVISPLCTIKVHMHSLIHTFFFFINIKYMYIESRLQRKKHFIFKTASTIRNHIVVIFVHNRRFCEKKRKKLAREECQNFPRLVIIIPEDDFQNNTPG